MCWLWEIKCNIWLLHCTLLLVICNTCFNVLFTYLWDGNYHQFAVLYTVFLCTVLAIFTLQNRQTWFITVYFQLSLIASRELWKFYLQFSLLFNVIALYGRLCCAFSFNQENILESTYEKQESVFYIHILKLSAVIFLINVSKFLFVISFGFRGFISLIF